MLGRWGILRLVCQRNLEVLVMEGCFCEKVNHHYVAVQCNRCHQLGFRGVGRRYKFKNALRGTLDDILGHEKKTLEKFEIKHFLRR